MTHPLPPASPAAAPQALGALRLATAEHHARIESLLGLGGAFGLAHHGQVLRAFAAFLAVWEPRVAQALPAPDRAWMLDFARLPLLRRDLHVLGLPWPSQPCVHVPRIVSPAQAWGSLYVLEGSALGGQLIARGLHQRLGMDAATGAAYHLGLGTGTAARWREFRLRCEAALGTAAARDEAADAAGRTFDGLAATFEDLLHDRAAA